MLQIALIKRAGYRFVCVYLLLYCVATQILGGLILFPRFSFPPLGTVWPMRDITYWIGTHVFHVSTLTYRGASSDTPFHWVQLAWIAVVAASVAIVSIDLATTTGTTSADKWLRLLLRFALAGQLFYFGMAKVIPAQFPPPSLATMVNPVGNLSLDDLLWTFMGSSAPYQTFTGCAEVIAGALLVIPVTATIGGIIAFVDLLQVFVLNMSYDVGLKQISFHLMAISLFLLSPQLGRIKQALVVTSPHPRRAVATQVAFGLYLLLMFTRLATLSWHNPGGPGAAKSPLYGIWDVKRLGVDGDTHPAMFNDYDRRWRRVIFDTPDLMIFQRLDDSFAHYSASIDVERSQITLQKMDNRLWHATLAFDRGNDEMSLDGDMDGHRIHIDLQRQAKAFRLNGRPFRWVRPPG